MNINLSEKLKSLRKEKAASQEKLAEYLGVSFQAVSKWENDNTYPDISLLPEISRFFGITVDELLQVEKLDEEELYNDYERRAEELFRIGKNPDVLVLWQEAYKKMPNNIQVKEMLMSAYYDTDKVQYKDRIVELGMEIYCSNAKSYYKGQAIRQIANTYAETGNVNLAEEWCYKSYQIMHSCDVIATQIFDGKDLLDCVNFCTYWFFEELFYMACRIDNSETVPVDTAYKKEVFETVAKLYEVLYQNDDMSFEDLQHLYLMHREIAEHEISLDNEENIVKTHLERMLACVKKSLSVQEHDLTLPMLNGWHIQAAPSDNKRWVRLMKKDLEYQCFDNYRTALWFTEINRQLTELL